MEIRVGELGTLGSSLGLVQKCPTVPFSILVVKVLKKLTFTSLLFFFLFQTFAK